MISLTVREWEVLNFGLGDDKIPSEQADRLLSVARTSAFAGQNGEGVLEHKHNGIRARDVVGILATSGCQLEILPKIEGKGEREVSDRQLRTRLVQMISIVHGLNIDVGNLAHHAQQRDTILEIIIRIFCAKLAEAVRQGLPRQYISCEEDLPVLRGRLNITRQFSTLAYSPHKLACTYDMFSEDIAINQIILATIIKLQRIATSSDNQIAIRELRSIYADVSEIHASALQWDQINLDRTNQRWMDLLSFAKLLLSENYQQTTSGSTDGYALLFQMNVLYEKYIARLLSKALINTGFRVTTQGGYRYCLFEGNKGRFRTVPDVIIHDSSSLICIIDSKWKRILPRKEDKKQGISESDIHQLMAYSRIYDCPNVILLYPHHSDLGDIAPEPIEYSIARENAHDMLTIATIDLTDSIEEQKAALIDIIYKIVDVDLEPDEQIA